MGKFSFSISLVKIPKVGPIRLPDALADET